MNEMSHSKPRALVWRAVKVLFGAWALAVAGTIVVAVATLIVGGQGDAPESLRYVSAALFLLGVPIMMRWLK
ncbi:MAG: hypothetical protein WCC36_09455 [Gammaproteobacteria bacterium]